MMFFRMREIKITYNHIKNIRSRAETIIKDLEKRDLLDDEVEDEILAAKSLDALDHLVSGFIFNLFLEIGTKLDKRNILNCFCFFLLQYAPFKAASKSSLFERAKALGLEEAANKLLRDPRCSLNFLQFVKRDTDGIDSVDKVKEGVKNIISHIFSKDTDVLDTIQKV